MIAYVLMPQYIWKVAATAAIFFRTIAFRSLFFELTINNFQFVIFHFVPTSKLISRLTSKHNTSGLQLIALFHEMPNKIIASLLSLQPFRTAYGLSAESLSGHYVTNKQRPSYLNTSDQEKIVTVKRIRNENDIYVYNSMLAPKTISSK